MKIDLALEIMSACSNGIREQIALIESLADKPKLESKNPLKDISNLLENQKDQDKNIGLLFEQIVLFRENPTDWIELHLDPLSEDFEDKKNRIAALMLEK